MPAAKLRRATYFAELNDGALEGSGRRRSNHCRIVDQKIRHPDKVVVTVFASPKCLALGRV